MRESHKTGAGSSKSNVLLSNSAQSPRGVFSFIGSLLAAAWGATLVSSAPAWGSLRRALLMTLVVGNGAFVVALAMLEWRNRALILG